MTYELYPNAWNDYFAGFSSKPGVENPITECGLYLKVCMDVTKGKEGLCGWCRRFFGIECTDLQDAVIRSVNPQVTCLDAVKDMVREWSDEEGVEVDFKPLKSRLTIFRWFTVQEL